VRQRQSGSVVLNGFFRRRESGGDFVMKMARTIALLALLAAGLFIGCKDDDDNGTPAATGGSGGAAGMAGSAGLAGEAGEAGQAGEAGMAGAAGEDAGAEAGIEGGLEAGDDASAEASLPDGDLPETSQPEGSLPDVQAPDAGCAPPTCGECCAALSPAGAAEVLALSQQCACGEEGLCAPQCPNSICAEPPNALEGTCAVCVRDNCLNQIGIGCTTAGCQTVYACLAACL
jgi:hypothetical protein